jgi:hypothetical protein
VADEPSGKRSGPLKIELPFAEAIKAALETPPEPEESKPFRKKPKKRAKRSKA